MINKTCGEIPLLDLCEFAHRTALKQPLCLRDEDYDRKTIKQHLKICNLCKSWCTKGYRIYKKIRYSETNFTKPQWRKLKFQRRTAHKAGNRFYIIIPKLHAQELDTIPCFIEFSLINNSWYLRFKIASKDLPDLNGLIIQYELQLDQFIEKEFTRLNFDASKNITSIWRPSKINHPKSIKKIKLTPLTSTDNLQ